VTRALPWMLLAVGTALAGAAESRPASGAPNAGCSAMRILADGRQIPAVLPPGLSGDAEVRHGPHSSAAWASSRASGRRGAASSSSSSSSSASTGGGESFARSASSYADEAGRTITIIRDGRGCRVTIDERTTGEE
jgi:hypothetical protein